MKFLQVCQLQSMPASQMEQHTHVLDKTRLACAAALFETWNASGDFILSTINGRTSS